MASSPRRARNAREVNAEPLSVPSVSRPGPTPRSDTAAWMTAIASGARQRTSSAQPVISRVQQTGRGVQIAPAVLGDPDRRHVQMPELVGALDAKESRPPAPALRAAPLQQPVLAHQPLHALAVDRPAELSGGERRDHPGPVGGVWSARPPARPDRRDPADEADPPVAAWAGGR